MERSPSNPDIVLTGSGARKSVLYAHVSSKEQAKEGFSIPAQLKLLRDYSRAIPLASAKVNYHLLRGTDLADDCTELFVPL